MESFQTLERAILDPIEGSILRRLLTDSPNGVTDFHVIPIYVIPQGIDQNCFNFENGLQIINVF